MIKKETQISLSGLALALIGIATICLAKEAAFLDLTTVTIREFVREPTSGTGGVGSGNQSKMKLFRLSLLSLGRERALIGDNVTFEAKLENTSKAPIVIPWNPHPADVEATDPSKSYKYVSCSFGLGGTDKFGEPVILGSVGLFGSPSVPKSLLELQPGDWVRIRAKVKLGVGDTRWSEKLRSRGQAELALIVSFSTSQTTVTPKNGSYHSASRSDGNYFKSSNSIPFLLKAWKPN